VRLVTSVELDDAGDPRAQSFSALHEAVLADGRRVTLLDDRGWSQSVVRSDGRTVTAIEALEAWSSVTREEIEREARTVVGPDEAYEGHSQEHMEDSHWAHLAGVLHGRGITVEPAELRRLPHDVVLGERLLAALDRRRYEPPASS
jgi:hypothetical protein